MTPADDNNRSQASLAQATPGDNGELTPIVEAELTERRYRWIPSMIWLLPLLAGLIGAILTYRELTQYGPMITVSFKTAEGLEAGKTKLRYKDVEIGTVQTIRLSEDLSHVIVSIRLQKDSEAFLAKDTRYWVVRPRADVSGVSGLSTLLSGAYIGVDAGKSAQHTTSFEGLETPPSLLNDESGTQYVLKARQLGSLGVGSPVLYRQVAVGRVTNYALDENGEGVSINLFINSPYDRFVGTNTRFWEASGVNAKIDANGVNVHTESMLTMLLGGIAFASPEEGRGMQADSTTPFRLARDQETAMASLDGPSRTWVLKFDQSLRGLQPGASVDFHGVELGRVKAIDVEIDDKTGDVSMPVLIEIYPERLNSQRGLDGTRKIRTFANDVEPEDELRRLQRLVDRGMRAQLRTGNLLTGQLYVALDFFPRAEKASIEQQGPWYIMPTVANSMDEFQNQIATLLTKVNKIPFEDIGGELKQTLAAMRRTLVQAEKTVKSVNTEMTPELNRSIQGLRKTLDSVDRMLASGSPLQEDMQKTLNSVARAADSMKRLTDYLERHPEALLRGKTGDRR